MAGQAWVTSSLGGYLANPRLSKSLRYAASPLYAFRQFVRIKEDFGAKRADQVLFDKVRRLTSSGGTLTETNTMPETNFVVVQDSTTIYEWGNAVPYTHKLDTLSEFDVTDITSVNLRDDMANTIDRAVASQATSAKFVALCSSTSTTLFFTNGSATGTADVSISDKNARDIVDFMKTKKIPRFGNGKDYVCVGSVTVIRELYDVLQALMAYTTPEFMYNDEVGRYYSTRYVEENNVLVNNKGSGGHHGQACFLGGDSLLEAIAEPEHLVMKVPEDYGRSKGVSWQALLGFKKIWDYSTDVEEHIVFVTAS